MITNRKRVSGRYWPGTCLCCCHECTPPPPSVPWTECTICCAALCCLQPSETQRQCSVLTCLWFKDKLNSFLFIYLIMAHFITYALSLQQKMCIDWSWIMYTLPSWCYNNENQIENYGSTYNFVVQSPSKECMTVIHLNLKVSLLSCILLAWRTAYVWSSHLGSLRRAGWVDCAGFHTVSLVSAAQSEATFPPPLVTIGQRAVTPEHTSQKINTG